MSNETLADLNRNTLIGYTDKRGEAWHYRADEQGDEPNHYDGAIPVEDVHRRLFDWQAVSGSVTATALTDDGVLTNSQNDFQAMMRSDTGAILGIFKSGYTPHQYGQWLLDNVESILGGGVQIGSAGLLRGGAQAWVQVELEDTLTGAGGVEYRPFLTAATSLDGSLATTYLTGAQVVVCDNTLSAALGGKTQQVKVQHSRYSMAKIEEIRAGLDIVEAVAANFESQLEQLTSTKVTDRLWAKFVDALVPMEPDASPTSARGKKRTELQQLWTNDLRVAPWRNTAYGVLAAVNTWEHHMKSTSSSKADRNATRMVTGAHDKLDQSTMRLLAEVR